MAPLRGLTNGWILPLLAAPFIGSFVGVLIARLPAGRPIAWSRSACDQCGRTLGPGEMVPILSFAWQRGACGGCGAPIARFHLWVELAALVLALSAAATGVTGPTLWTGCALAWTLLALAWIDARTYTLPDALTLPLLLAGLAQTLWLTPEFITDHALAAAFAYLSFRLLDLLYQRLRGRPGLGAGDAKLLAAGGAWLGTLALPRIVLIAALLGLTAAAVARLRGAELRRDWRLPFGPCLAAAIWALWLAEAVSP